MTANLSEIQAEAQQLISDHKGRTELFDQIDEMYFLEPKDRAKIERAQENLKTTLDAGPRNQVKAAIKLMVASDAKFKIPFDKKQPNAATISNAMEKAAEEWWNQAGRVARAPITHDIVESGLLYDETHVAVQSVQSLLALYGERPTAARRRIEKIARRTPFLWKVLPARECYSRWDDYGMNVHLRVVRAPKYKIVADWGKTAEDLLSGKSAYDKLDVYEWWNLENQVVWIGEQNKAIVNKTHELPMIPIDEITSEGSPTLWPGEIKKARQPFLYSVAKSGIWQRRNAALTVLYTIIFAIGANPMFVWHRNQEGKELTVDYSVPGGVIALDPGEDFRALEKNVIDPSLIQGWDLAEAILEDSTMYKAARGQPLGANAPYSMVALLSQSGRLPLISPQRRLGWLHGGVMEIAFELLKQENKKHKVLHRGELIDIDPAMIPDDFQVDASLEISLPQDRLQAANIATMLMKSGLVSKEWIQENLLDVGQSSEMEEAIWIEQLTDLLMKNYGETQLQMEMQKMMGDGGPTPGGSAPGSPPPTTPQNPNPPPVAMPPEGGMPVEQMMAGGQGPNPAPGMEGMPG